MLDPTPNLRKLADAELMRIELETRRLIRRTLCVGASLVLAAIALVMFSLGGFYALTETYGPVIAAFIMAGGLALACLLALYFAFKSPGRAAKLEMQLAAQAIENARDHVKADASAIERELDRLSMGLLSLVRGQSGSGMPALTMLIGVLATLSPSLMRVLKHFFKRD